MEAWSLEVMRRSVGVGSEMKRDEERMSVRTICRTESRTQERDPPMYWVSLTLQSLESFRTYLCYALVAEHFLGT